ncbi:MAG: hypothetical protein A2X84_02555 [Desulfuromonadaceae bacterium GWC2_58_13]|nr:MAG: hypothetical protein A2X84_02555 [Desulfuromonadaceae bacterium GWC2_58_13]
MIRATLMQNYWRFLIWTLCLFPVSAWCGNRVMVEKRVQELAELNQQLLDQESEIPKDGHLELKAQVHYGADGSLDLRVYSRKFSTISEEPIQFEGKRTQLLSD